MPVASPFSLVSAADSQSGTDFRTLYAVPAGKQAFVKSVIASNTRNGTTVPTLQLVKGAVQAQLAAPSLAQGASTNLLAGTLVMSAGDSIRQKSDYNYIKFSNPVYPNLIEPRVVNPTFTGIERVNGVLVIFGYTNGYSQPYGNFLFVSTDNGVTWSYKTFDSLNTPRTVYGICYGAGLYVVVCDSGFIYTSPDLVTWTQRTSNTNKNITSIVYGNGRFVAVATGGDTTNSIITSPDAITWTARASAVGFGNPQVAYDATINKFVIAGGYPSGYLYSSTDGVTWATVSGMPIAYNVQALNGKFYARVNGGQNQLAVSTDGVNFYYPYQIYLPGSTTNNRPQEFKAVGGRLFASSSTVTKYTSDGVNWVDLSTSQFPVFPSLAHDGTNFWAANTNSSGSLDVYKILDMSVAAAQTCAFTASIIEVAA